MREFNINASTYDIISDLVEGQYDSFNFGGNFGGDFGGVGRSDSPVTEV